MPCGTFMKRLLWREVSTTLWENKSESKAHLNSQILKEEIDIEILMEYDSIMLDSIWKIILKIAPKKPTKQERLTSYTELLSKYEKRQCTFIQQLSSVSSTSWVHWYAVN